MRGFWDPILQLLGLMGALPPLVRHGEEGNESAAPSETGTHGRREPERAVADVPGDGFFAWHPVPRETELVRQVDMQQAKVDLAQTRNVNNNITVLLRPITSCQVPEWATAPRGPTRRRDAHQSDPKRTRKRKAQREARRKNRG